MTRKTFTTFALAAALITTVQAQRSLEPVPAVGTNLLRPIGMTQPELRPTESGARGGGAGTVVWSEDFSNGFAGANPSGAWTTDGANGNIWVINTTAPTGAFTPANQRIQSTTFANGFAKFASDSANCTWVGNTPTALPVAQFTPWDGSLVSPIIDLSATPFVEIEFQQRSRYCCSGAPFFLEVSSDGGASWTTAIQTNVGLATNQDPTFTETRRFSLANAISEDPSNVRFRFHHNGDIGTSHYFWQVDDIRIMTLPDYEMVMNYGYTSTTGTGEEYGRIPASQLPPTMNIGAELLNYGGFEQTNVVITCSVTNESDVEVFSSVTNVGTLAGGETIVTDEDVALPELPVGLYTATFTVTSDQIDLEFDPSDNTAVRTFEVTDFVYSLDNVGNHPTGTQTTAQTGTPSFADNATDLKMMTMYMVNAPLTVTAIEVGLGSSSRAGGSIVVSILDTADVFAVPSVVTNPVNGIESNPYVLTAADLNAGKVTVLLPTPITLFPNGYYAVATISGSGTAGTTDAEVFVLDDTTVPQPGVASAIWLPFDINDEGQEGPHFYGNGEAWAIRLISDPTVGVKETAELAGVSMYPNPTNGLLRVSTIGNEKHLIEVLNMLGEVVLINTFAGTITLDLAEFAQGVYSVRVSNGTASTTQRVVLK